MKHTTTLRWVTAGGALACAVGLYLEAEIGPEREIREMLDGNERAALFQRTLETLRTTCPHTKGPALAEFCGKQADFIKHFPECDDDCRQLADRFAPQPTR